MRKEWSALKIVTTRKDHKCEACDVPIPKGDKALVIHGFNRDDGYFANYFHLDAVNKCYLDFMEATYCDGEDEGIILAAARDFQEKQGESPCEWHKQLEAHREREHKKLLSHCMEAC